MSNKRSLSTLPVDGPQIGNTVFIFTSGHNIKAQEEELVKVDSISKADNTTTSIDNKTVYDPNYTLTMPINSQLMEHVITKQSNSILSDKAKQNEYLDSQHTIQDIDQSGTQGNVKFTGQDEILNLFNQQSESNTKFTKMKREAILKRIGEQSNIIPMWSGKLTLPGISWCDTSAIFHSILGPIALGPELGRLSHFNLPTNLIIQGRIPTESVFSYLRQVIKSPSRTVGFAQFIGKYNNQPIFQSNMSSVDIETPFHDTLSYIMSHLHQANRFGVVYSGLNPPSSFNREDCIIDKKTGLSSYHGWYIKDLYILTYDEKKPFPEPVSNLDVGHISFDAINENQDSIHHFITDLKAFQNEEKLLFMIFILARMPVQHIALDTSSATSSGAFKYKRLT